MTTSSPSRRVIVHIGAQKTGSTSLHKFLARNRDALASRFDIRVPERGTLTRELGKTCALYSLRPKKQEASLVSLLQELRRDLEGDDRVCIISHENIIGAMMGRGSERDVYPEVARIIAHFETHLAPFKPDYVLYTRKIAAWKVSVHNQAVKSDGYTGSFAAFEDETADSRDWVDVRRDMEATVGKDRVRVFALEDGSSPERPGRQLLRFAGLSDDEIDTLTPLEGLSNQSLNAGSLEFMRQLNKLGVNQPARKAMAELIKNNQSLFVAGFASDRKA